MRFRGSRGALVAGIAAGLVTLVGCSSSTAPSAGSSNTAGSSVTGEPSPAAGEATTSPAPTVHPPADWPKDIPAPAGLTLQDVGTPQPGEPPGNMSATFVGPGSEGAVEAALSEQFRRAGFVADRALGDSAGGVTMWKKGSVSVQVVVFSQGKDVTVIETIQAP